MERTVRIWNVRRIFPTAHWDGARSSALINYEYCSKGGNYQCIGDFSKILSSSRTPQSRPASVPMILRGLMDNEKIPQIICSKEYSDRYLYYGKVSNDLRQLQVSIKAFNEWKTKKLFPWQYQVLQLLANQDNRKVLWIVDNNGNNGKSFLADYINILYGYVLFNANITSRDILPLIDNSKGFAFDIPRAMLVSFDYSLVECAKNGYFVSGKYGGSKRR